MPEITEKRSNRKKQQEKNNRKKTTGKKKQELQTKKLYVCSLTFKPKSLIKLKGNLYFTCFITRIFYRSTVKSCPFFRPGSLYS